MFNGRFFEKKWYPFLKWFNFKLRISVNLKFYQ